MYARYLVRCQMRRYATFAEEELRRLLPEKTIKEYIDAAIQDVKASPPRSPPDLPETLIDLSVDYNFLTPPNYAQKFVRDLPFDVMGTTAIVKFHPKHLIKKIIVGQKARDMDFKSIFYKFYDRWLNALASNDMAFINSHCEKRLADKCIKALEELSQSGLKVSFSLP